MYPLISPTTIQLVTSKKATGFGLPTTSQNQVIHSKEQYLVNCITEGIIKVYINRFIFTRCYIRGIQTQYSGA